MYIRFINFKKVLETTYETMSEITLFLISMSDVVSYVVCDVVYYIVCDVVSYVFFYIVP